MNLFEFFCNLISTGIIGDMVDSTFGRYTFVQYYRSFEGVGEEYRINNQARWLGALSVEFEKRFFKDMWAKFEEEVMLSIPTDLDDFQF